MLNPHYKELKLILMFIFYFWFSLSVKIEISYTHGHNIFRLTDVSPNFTFSSQVKRSMIISNKHWYIRVASRVAE